MQHPPDFYHHPDHEFRHSAPGLNSPKRLPLDERLEKELGIRVRHSYLEELKIVAREAWVRIPVNEDVPLLILAVNEFLILGFAVSRDCLNLRKWDRG